jgi:hypothetical protein
MQKIIEQLALDAGITVAEASCIFNSFSGQLVCKVPALKPVIDAVFENAEDAALKGHINKLIVNLQQQQGKEIFGNWIIPREQLIIHWEESKELF